jgi:hypothetical protein
MAAAISAAKEESVKMRIGRITNSFPLGINVDTAFAIG